MSALNVLPHVRAETLLIHRREDRTIPIEAGRRLAAELPNARLLVLDGKVHLPWINGGSIAEMVHAFFSGNEVQVSGPSPVFASDCRLDEANREFILEGRRVPTTRLEYGVMQTLIRAKGRVVSRDEMLSQVWNTPFAGSNKVEAVVRLLRKKLGFFAPSIETVTGHGYRFAGWKHLEPSTQLGSSNKRPPEDGAMRADPLCCSYKDEME